MTLKILDKIVDWMLEKLQNYKLKRRMEEIRKRDPFIYP
jgi:hypothetical protein